MDIINWLFINIADAIRWLGAVIAAFFGAVFHALDVILNPILSPFLSVVNPICTTIGDGVYAVLAPFPVWLGLTILSALAGVAMLLAFRYTSNQTAIRRVKDEMKANLLALRLYKDELRVTFRAQLRLLWAVVKLQRYILPSILIMLPPMMLVLAQMGARYQWRSLRTGERTILRMRFGNEALPIEDPIIEPGPGLVVEAGPVPGGGETVWRIRGGESGRHTIRFQVGSATVEKELVVSDAFQRVSAQRPGSRWTARLLHPTEPPLPAGGPVKSIEIGYPGVDSWIYGADWWVAYFLVVSLLFAVVVKPLFKVTF